MYDILEFLWDLPSFRPSVELLATEVRLAAINSYITLFFFFFSFFFSFFIHMLLYVVQN